MSQEFGDLAEAAFANQVRLTPIGGSASEMAPSKRAVRQSAHYTDVEVDPESIGPRSSHGDS